MYKHAPGNGETGGEIHWLLREKLLLATNNRGKLREYRELLQGLPYQLITLAEAGIMTEVREDGKTLEENAVLKASTDAAESGLLTLADDSGLEVDALNGAPGPLSARYAGEKATDAERISYLLSKMEGVPREKRTARFRCVIALSAPEGETRQFPGECPGYITFAPRGSLGFGYDPIFYLPELGKTMAEITMTEKNQVSHRRRAAEKARRYLLERSKDIS